MEPTPRLNEISTLWSVVLQANHDAAEAARLAQRRLLERYGGAVRRYLLGALRDPDAAEELFQEFALLLVHGDLRGADRQRGRFRDFVKGVLFHLIARHHREQKRRPRKGEHEHRHRHHAGVGSEDARSAKRRVTMETFFVEHHGDA